MKSAAPEPGTIGIELQRTFRASPERVFRAWTQPAALREWWCPPGWVAGEIEIDLRIGGTYSIAMSRAGSADARVSVSGQFLEVRPPERLVYTWRWEGAFAEMPETLVILDLRGSDNETLLTLHHDKFVDLGLRQQHRSGWMAACDRLDRLVTPPAVLPNRAAAVKGGLGRAVADLAAWLAGLGLAKYAGAFGDQEIDFDLLPLLTEEDLKELGLPIGPRRKLLEAIRVLRGAISPDSSERRSEAERRQLTIMFVDLANSTPLALRLDPEAMREVLRAFQDAVTGEIGRLGYVAKLMGDGVLAYFGWPRAHEDDPKRAVAAALAITDAVDRLASPIGEKLACRVGIATGLVVVGDLIGEGTAREHAVVGPTPNLAARLQEAAGPGEVMIAATTRLLLGSSFAVEAIGERRLKGHAEPVPLFRVLRRETHESRFVARDEADLGPIVGREAELAALRLAWEQAKSGRGQAVLLTGEAGIGKSRLLQALANTIADDKPAQQVFQCSPLHSDNPFWPVVQRSASSIAIVGRGMNDANDRDRRRSPRETVDALTKHLLDIIRAGPALFVFEDVQWADRATVELMRSLAGAVAGMPVLLIVTSRPDGEPHLGAAANLSRLALARLDGPAAAALVAAIAGSHQLAARLTSEILARSDGIPLFIEEMSKAVIEMAPGDEAVSVPATLRDSLIARLDGSPVMKAAAQIASCIGRDFDEGLLLSISDIVPMRLREGLAVLLQAGHVVAQGAGWFRFKHALLCDIAYETLLTPRRQKLHRRIAEALEAMTDNLADREPESLARHWFAAGESGQAEVYWLRARHRVAHWEEQLDALADYLEAYTAEVVPIHGGPGSRNRH